MRESWSALDVIVAAEALLLGAALLALAVECSKLTGAWEALVIPCVPLALIAWSYFYDIAEGNR